MRRTPARVLAAALALLALACVLGGCAGGSPSADALLSDTFQSHAPITSGHIDLALTVRLDGAKPAKPGAEVLGLGLSGQFQGLGSSQLPDFALQLRLSEGGHTLHAGATATGEQLYIELEGAQFIAPAGTTAQLQKSYAQATHTASSAQSKATFSALGIDPGEWITDPQIVGSSGGVTHVSGELNTTKFLADAQKISGAGGGALGLAGSALPSSGGIAALAGSVRGARVDVYTGTHDHVLRRLTLSANIAATASARSTLGVSSGATLTLDLRFAELNKPQTITAPSGARPLSELPAAIEALGHSLGASS